MYLIHEPRRARPAVMSGRDEHEAGEQRGKDEPVVAVLLDHVEDDDHERAGGSADDVTRAAQRRDQEARNDAGHETLLWCRPGRNGKRHGQR